MQGKDDILNFWFREHGNADWFKKDKNFDLKIKEKFLKVWLDLSTKKIDFEQNPQDLLAEVILFDQFSRNIFRGDSRAYSQDSRALEISNYILKNKHDSQFSNDEKVFLYLPFMHSENIENQKISVKLFAELNYFNYSKYAQEHYQEIEKFDKFRSRYTVNEITIAGFGFSGLSFFVKYLDYCLANNLKNVKIEIYSKNKFAKGEAYATSNETDLLNVVKGNMTLKNDLGMTFTDWLEYKYKSKYREEIFLPRKVFGQYLIYIYNLYFEKAKEAGVKVKIYNREVGTLKTKDLNTLNKKIFICIGSIKKGSFEMKNNGNGKNVLIVGTGLSAIDKFIQLSQTKSTFGKVTMYSRSGVLPKVSSKYNKLSLKFLNLESLKSEKINLSYLYKSFLQELGEHVDNPGEYLSKELNSRNILDFEIGKVDLILKSLDLDFVKYIWLQLSTDEKLYLIRNYFSFWQKITSPFPLKNAKIIEKHILSKSLIITNQEPNYRKFDQIYDCTGYKKNSECSLVIKMIDRGLAERNLFGGINSMSKNLYIIGDLSFGENIFLNTANFIDGQIIDVFKEILN